MKLHKVRSKYLNDLLNNNDEYLNNNLNYYDSKNDIIINNVNNQEYILEDNFEDSYERRGLNDSKIMLHNKPSIKKSLKRKNLLNNKKRTCKNRNPTLREFLSRRFR